ncbi:hypothetical protein HAX54_005942 [Datura stramonium]|uniref:Uncharacterized protein n=1 Tax=Datura stramonium TaxID=4076 RepID=A0ABS8WXT6_DATST|nr:hypothetical protein [Datura stramonium]
MILQDEEETQVEVIMFGTDITHYEDMFVPFQTYLVSVANVKESTKKYGNSIHDFTWVIYRSTIVEPIEMVTPPEHPLLPPTRLTVASFDNFDYQVAGSELVVYLLQDVLAIVTNGSPSSYASNGNRIQEFIIMDQQ